MVYIIVISERLYNNSYGMIYSGWPHANKHWNIAARFGVEISLHTNHYKTSSSGCISLQAHDSGHNGKTIATTGQHTGTSLTRWHGNPLSLDVKLRKDHAYQMMSWPSSWHSRATGQTWWPCKPRVINTNKQEAQYSPETVMNCLRSCVV